MPVTLISALVVEAPIEPPRTVLVPPVIASAPPTASGALVAAA